MVRRIIQIFLRLISYPFFIIFLPIIGLTLVLSHTIDWAFNDNFHSKWETNYRKRKFKDYKAFTVNILSLGMFK